MSPSIAVAHYPEGAGHATRMVAIANELQAAGATVRVAGGGAGSAFVSLNGYDAFEPTVVDYIDTYQGGSVWQTAKRSLPASLGRIADYQAWLAATEPDALVTDDMFAAMAAVRCGVPLYALKHDMPGLYEDRLERVGAGFHTVFQLSCARELFYPVVWPGSRVDPARATRIPPVALDDAGETAPDAPEVLVVPSHYSSLASVTDHLRRQGYTVRNVAADDWEPVASLLPYIRGADVVVCSGYSSIMDAAVAGTPCVIHPATDEQRAVADRIDAADVTGFTTAERPIDVLDAVADPPAAPSFDNGARVVARRVVTDLRDPDPYAASETADAAETPGESGTLRALPTLAAVCLVAGGATVASLPRRGRRGLARVGARTLGAVTRATSGLARAARAVGGRLSGVGDSVERSGRRLVGLVRPE